MINDPVATARGSDTTLKTLNDSRSRDSWAETCAVALYLSKNRREQANDQNHFQGRIERED